MSGYIYILTNRSFPQYVKIGYATDVNDRLKQLNRSECVPYAFRVYATYRVQRSFNSDKKLHKLIDLLNPDLRTIDTVNGKTRRREFYAMSPATAYDILKAMAEIHGCVHSLKRHSSTQKEKAENELAQQIDTEHKERASNFKFSMCGIKPGDYVKYKLNPEITVEVVDDKRVSFGGVTMSLTALAKQLSGRSNGVEGPKYFIYHDKTLNEIRRERDEVLENVQNN